MTTITTQEPPHSKATPKSEPEASQLQNVYGFTFVVTVPGVQHPPNPEHGLYVLGASWEDAKGKVDEAAAVLFPAPAVVTIRQGTMIVGGVSVDSAGAQEAMGPPAVLPPAPSEPAKSSERAKPWR